MQQIDLIYPDDWHCHFRDGPNLATTVPAASFQFKRAIVMPNLPSPIVTWQEAVAYLERIRAFIPKGNTFTPLMTLYLTDETTPQQIIEAKQSGHIYGAKLYPAHATTHSAKGVSSISRLYSVFSAMEKVGLPLLIHGEVTTPDIDIFDREAVFIEQHLASLIKNFPGLKIVLEHITTCDAVDFVKESPATLGATITPHHLWLNRNALLAGGIKPHYYCLPVLKRKSHQDALIQAAISGNPKFFLGTDSAPHAQKQKESACGCAGIFNSHAAIEMYAQVFESFGALDKLEGFASKFGAQFYDLPYNKEKLTLIKKSWTIPSSFTFGADTLIPFLAGETLNWQSAHQPWGQT